MKDLIKKCLSENLIKNEIYSRNEIKHILLKNDISEANIPNITSMTYNQWNKGMHNMHLNPLFEYLARNQYRFLGENYPYTGDLLNKVRGGGLIKIGYWLDGNLFDFNNQLANYNFDINILSRFKKTTDNIIEELEKIGFINNGKYFKKGDKVEVSKINKERHSLVYAFIANDEVMYFGKTVQGYIRPFSYHKNSIMKTVQEGIHNLVQNNTEILIFTRIFKNEDFIQWNNLSLNIIEAVEQALINKYNPKWNKYQHR